MQLNSGIDKVRPYNSGTTVTKKEAESSASLLLYRHVLILLSMYNPHSTKIKYPENTDAHYLVVKKNDGFLGVDAVIDKDFAACKLASQVDADILLILTAVSKVCIKYNTSMQEEISAMTTEEAMKYVKRGEFAKGSMLPKILACVDFINNRPKGIAIIADLSEGLAALSGHTGTRITK